jgi:uncharacterized protein YkvS
MNNVEKFAKKSVEILFKNNGKGVVEKSQNDSFPYKSTIFNNFFQIKTTMNSTIDFNNFPLLNSSFTHFPHSLLLLLLKI